MLLFDEVEKAHSVLWNAMLGILEDGKLTLGDNNTTDFTGSIIVMTSNVGTREMTHILQRRTLGFEGTDSQSALGARPLRRAIEVELVDPLSRLLATQRINPGDVIEVEVENDRLAFYRRPRAESGLVV